MHHESGEHHERITRASEAFLMSSRERGLLDVAQVGEFLLEVGVALAGMVMFHGKCESAMFMSMFMSMLIVLFGSGSGYTWLWTLPWLGP